MIEISTVEKSLLNGRECPVEVFAPPECCLSPSICQSHEDVPPQEKTCFSSWQPQLILPFFILHSSPPPLFFSQLQSPLSSVFSVSNSLTLFLFRSPPLSLYASGPWRYRVWSLTASFHLADYHAASGQQPKVHIGDLLTQA